MYKVESVKSHTEFNFSDVIFVKGKYDKDELTSKIINVHGDCYRLVDGQSGAFIGTFEGTPTETGEIDYDLSRMSRADTNLVWDAIEAIEAQILGENSDD